MAAKLSGSGGGKYTVEANSEINVTPFVDIMLVLLIIFMVAAPLATVSVPVTLPRAVAPPAQNPPKPVFISIQNGGEVWIGDFRTSVGSLGEDLKVQIGTRDPEQERIFIRADQQTRYGDFMQVMNALQDNGFYSVALVGEDQS
ncbi:biopolymer transporter ExbD [Brevundimonas diminuta]|uniref:ExbD/TolR family protein n=1 Tax=Brevundimonas TaxID=41275 RepID=UPI0002A2B224|nr:MULTISPECIES: biopolymer transporter ExbD [Brevundimonas]EKY25854.1 putative TonB system transport protein ExbD [Brevundimonas diminuta 470-4]RJT21594.1 biopolymer transporter ExbD [Chakrabartia godavariana]HAC01450.1 biopolymer transporter ExbD [Brevundimonas sp.]MCO8017435.1 biopolymer transporter ExbD [Brevundimonas diminuta]MCO8020955.1 biopolymer transporter ExbD [Brevundimonas diminuta]